ncbi:hypothetical protein AGMMS49545_02500 [Betaproteobacteria bacterium]|nr:hypothetical protein AGMMS49545_02500 [Betaproteobacteria bacterium]GHU40242.1 hypothetical protein AGMMS50289_01470 [Betaproteobacteria bacterium]
MKLITMVLVGGVLAGCATHPTELHDAQTVPAARVTWGDAEQDDAATVVVTRDSGFLGAALSSRLRIDESLVGSGGRAADYPGFLPYGAVTASGQR